MRLTLDEKGRNRGQRMISCKVCAYYTKLKSNWMRENQAIII